MKPYRQNNFFEQTHFIGVLLPDDITSTLQNCRRYMNETYGCRSGHATPVHATLIPPFVLPDKFSTRDLVNAIEKEFSGRHAAFTAHIDNFSAFGDRTIFAKVPTDENWKKLRDSVYAAVSKAVPDCIKKDTRPLQIHLTVANRDIPPGVTADALKVLNELNLVEDFPVDNITVFERKNGKWIAGVTMELK